MKLVIENNTELNVLVVALDLLEAHLNRTLSTSGEVDVKDRLKAVRDLQTRTVIIWSLMKNSYE